MSEQLTNLEKAERLAHAARPDFPPRDFGPHVEASLLRSLVAAQRAQVHATLHLAGVVTRALDDLRHAIEPRP